MFIAGQDVYFFARVSADLNNLPQTTTIVFDAIITNKGGAYNATSGKFTASVAGAYMFSWTVQNKDQSFMNAALFHNTDYIAVAQADSYNSSYGDSGSNSAILDLQSMDTVHLEVWIGGNTDNHQVAGIGHSTFSGWLITN